MRNHRVLLALALALVLLMLLPSVAMATSKPYYIMNPLYPTDKNVAALDMGQNYVGTYKVPVFGTYGRQCVEYVKRFYYYRKGYNTTSTTRTNAKNWTGNAYTYWSSYSTKKLNRYANGGTVAPKAGDILVWTNAYGSGYGHVAIVTSVSTTGGYVYVMEQNWPWNEAGYRKVSMKVSSGRYTITGLYGWLRAK